MKPSARHPFRGAPAGALALTLALLTALAASLPFPATAKELPEPIAESAATSPASVTLSDWRWLNRMSFGADAASLERLRREGRARYLDEQLASPAPPDPPVIAATIAAMPISRLSAEQRFRAMQAEQFRLRALPLDATRQAARMALNKKGLEAVQETQQRHLLRAIYSPAQLREQMTWFWMNHFSIYGAKGNVRWTLPDYEEKVVRPRVFGKFKDLLMATLTSPAMLEYLDNAQSSVGKVNENYARELLELHTLGISGGPSGSRYTQQDVQELARVLTGVGIMFNEQPPRLPAQRQALYVADGLFQFNPNRHDFGAKTLLGQSIAPVGFGEVEQAVALLARQPATARFISTKLATYFVAETPPSQLVDRMVESFQKTDGDIAAVLRTMFLSPEMDAALGGGSAARPGQVSGKFKDPMQFVISSLRLAYGGPGSPPISNTRPAANWLAQLGESLYSRVSPDGYPLSEAAWASSGQMVKRFEIARIIGTGPPALFMPQDGAPDMAPGMAAGMPTAMSPEMAPSRRAAPALALPPTMAAPAGNPAPGRKPPVPVLTTPLFRSVIEPTLTPATRSALAEATTPVEWNTTFLSSPEWMQR